MSNLKRFQSQTFCSKKHEKVGPVDEHVAKERKIGGDILNKIIPEVRQTILDKTILPCLLDYIYVTDKSLEARLEEVVRNNSLFSPRFGKHTSWLVEFKSVLSSLKTCKIHRNPAFQNKRWDDREEETVITGGRLTLSNFIRSYRGRFSNREVKFTYFLPKNSESTRRAEVLDYNFVVDMVTSTEHYEFQVGCQHDIDKEKEDKPVDTNTTILHFNIREPERLIFDDENNVIYFIDTGIYRQSLVHPTPPELLWRVDDATTLVEVGVGNDKVFAIGNRMFEVRHFHHLLYYNIKTKVEIAIRQELNTLGLDVHGNTCVVLRFWEIFVYTFKDDDYTRIRIPYVERRRLNRHTYLILVEGEEDEFVLKTVSIVNDEVIERFVQYCEYNCVFRLLGDNMFYVLEPLKRAIWYQERPGDLPYLLHQDDEWTRIDRVDRPITWESKPRSSRRSL